ncbi:DUF3084 domain-containing protein [Chamaesiphon sp. VAR_48_metabat_135_sub]|uniref:DUF3084 domain-containing protein n=1 Tax=Chamaesiphon sp. VAR_48_metabat_135_sub TaxID=2964699 RepID=UPI00286CFF9A|nr:DUF3084 domain-containing protein [Chamaesiphon sp. VAR_48_metabat_135_sub]
MTSGYILIGAILILGGIIAVSGDRIGTRVGKARLTLFKLRPRQTATLVTIFTGTLISASVLTLIFGASEQLRTGVFDLQKIQRKLSDTKENLARALEQKDRVQKELEIARNEQSEAKNLLSGINKSLKDEVLKQSVAAQNFKNTQQQLQSVSGERNDLVREVTEIARQRSDLKAQQQTISAQVEELQERANDLENGILPLQQQLNSTSSKKSQLQQQLNTITALPNLVSQTQRLQTYESTVKKVGRDLEQQTTRLTNMEVQLQTQESELLKLETQIKQLDGKLAVRQAQLKEKDRQHQQLEREFQTRAMQLKLRDRQLKKIELQIKANRQGLASLEKEVNNIEQEYRKIRQGNIGILRNQVLASTILKVSSIETATKAINSLLIQANLNALQATNPDDFTSKRQVIEIAPNQLTQLKQQIADRQNYVVRVFSTGNYVIGDKNIQVFIDATPNRKLFDRDTKIAGVTIDPMTMTEEQIRQQLNILLVTSQLRARRSGILDDRPQIGDGQLTTYVQFLERVKKLKYSIEIQTIVDRDTYTLGPLIIKLQAIAGNKVLFNTYSNVSIDR